MLGCIISSTNDLFVFLMADVADSLALVTPNRAQNASVLILIMRACTAALNKPLTHNKM
jgi:hypothetical protein